MIGVAISNLLLMNPPFSAGAHVEGRVADAAYRHLASALARGINGGDQTIIIATGRSAQDSANQVGQQLTRRIMNVQPTLTVRPGFPVRVLVNKDLVLRP